MQISTRISPEDYSDFLTRPVFAGGHARRGWIAITELLGVGTLMFVSMGLLIWTVASLGYQGVLARLMQDPTIIFAMLIGLLAMAVVAYLVKRFYRLPLKIHAEMRNPLDESALKEGVSVGEARYIIDDRGIRCSLALVRDFYSWDAFQRVEETEACFFLMVDPGTAEIVPKRAFADSESLHAFRAMLAARIGGAS